MALSANLCSTRIRSSCCYTRQTFCILLNHPCGHLRRRRQIPKYHHLNERNSSNKKKNNNKKLLLFKWISGSLCILGSESRSRGWMLLKRGAKKNSLS